MLPLISGILAQDLEGILAEAVREAPSSSPVLRLRRSLVPPEAIPRGAEDAEDRVTEPQKGLQTLQNYEYLTFEEGEELQRPEVDLVPSAEAEETGPLTASDHDLSAMTTSPEMPSSSAPTESPKTYIAASYVKFVEAAGARVVPIL